MGKKLIILLLSVIFTFASAFSADTNRRGNMALLFQISEGSLHPKAFYGGVGFQFYISENTAIRLPFGFSTFHKLTEKPVNTETNKIEDAWNLAFTPGIRYNFGRGENILVYTGGQLMFDYSDSVLTGNNFLTNERTRICYTWGIGLMLGAEWFPYRSLSLGLEYSPFLTFKGGKTSYKSGGFEQTDKLPELTNFQTNLASVLLIISFYFD